MFPISTTTISPKPQEDESDFMEMMEQRMKERIETMNSACNSKRKEICKLPQMAFPGSLYNRNYNVSFYSEISFWVPLLGIS